MRKKEDGSRVDEMPCTVVVLVKGYLCNAGNLDDVVGSGFSYLSGFPKSDVWNYMYNGGWG